MREHHDVGRSSAARTAALLLAEFVGFASLLFVTRFLARGHLMYQSDQECHIGGIAVDVLAHGIRFPLLVYAPNEYDNGSFFSGLLAAASFSLLGRNVLALKLVTHLISAAGAVATLSLLRGCLAELGMATRRARRAATTTLVIALALAPRVVTFAGMYAVGNHAEGSAIDALLLALFARRLHTRPAVRTAALWVLVGFALYLNKGTFLVIPVLGVAETVLGRRSPSRLAAAFTGFMLGALPELLVIAQRHAMGWMTMAAKAERNAPGFPGTFIDSLLFLGEYRVELLGLWALAICVGIALLIRSLVRFRHSGARGTAATPPVTLALVVAVTLLHIAALTGMAKGGLDAYEIYGYPTLVVLFSVLVAWLCAHAGRCWGKSTETWVEALAIVATLVVYRPDAMTWDSAKVRALWRNRAGAACFWRFAEGFEREHDYGLAPPGQTREQHAIERCRTLSEQAQVLDCIGGIARELNWRRSGSVKGEPPAELSALERRAYAYGFGTHRKGNATACAEFDSLDLARVCGAAVQLECLVIGDMYTRLSSGQGLRRPVCNVPEPPMNGYWAAMRLDLLTRTAGNRPDVTRAWVKDTDLRLCQPVFDQCYGSN